MYNPNKDPKAHLITIWFCNECKRFFIQQGGQMYDQTDEDGNILNSDHPCPYCGSAETFEFSSVLDTTAFIEAKMFGKDETGDDYVGNFWLKNQRVCHDKYD